VTTGLLFDPINPAPAMADTSLSHWQRILPTLQAREFEVLILVFDYLAATGYWNVTGGELAQWAQRDKTILRPRITGLVKKGLLYSTDARASRAKGEAKCHPVYPAIPRAAIERARKAKP
jgi:hypothetical protein